MICIPLISIESKRKCNEVYKKGSQNHLLFLCNSFSFAFFAHLNSSGIARFGRLRSQKKCRILIPRLFIAIHWNIWNQGSCMVFYCPYIPWNIPTMSGSILSWLLFKFPYPWFIHEILVFHGEMPQSSCFMVPTMLGQTHPAYPHVATRNLFYFDSSYRPIPLETSFLGITESLDQSELQESLPQELGMPQNSY